MKFVTREKPKVDRVACPWLIKKFIDTNAELLFVPADQVMAVVERENALPYDVPIEGEDTLIVAWVALIRRIPSDLGAVSKTPIRATSRRQFHWRLYIPPGHLISDLLPGCPFRG